MTTTVKWMNKTDQQQTTVPQATAIEPT